MRFATIFGGLADQKAGRMSALAHKSKAETRMPAFPVACPLESRLAWLMHKSRRRQMYENRI